MGAFSVDPHGHMSETEVRKRCRQLSRRCYRLEHVLLALACEFTALAPPGDNRPAIARARRLIGGLQKAYED